MGLSVAKKFRLWFQAAALIEAGDGQGAEIEKENSFFSLPFFALKICEIKEQKGQGVNAGMGESLGQKKTE